MMRRLPGSIYGKDRKDVVNFLIEKTKERAYNSEELSSELATFLGISQFRSYLLLIGRKELREDMERAGIKDAIGLPLTRKSIFFIKNSQFKEYTKNIRVI